MKGKELETTFWRFYSEMRVFISKLFKDPIKAKPGAYLTDRGLTRKRLIDDMIKRNIIERSEKILDGTNSDKKKPTYTVKYKIYKEDFEKKMKRLYTKYFEKNLPENKKNEEELNEDGATSCASVGSNGNLGSGQYDTPLFSKPISRTLYEEEKKKRVRKIIVTEDQLKRIMEATATTTIGDYTYDTPGLVLKTSDGKKDPSYDR